MTSAVLELSGVAKSFTMHLQGGLVMPVVRGVEFSVERGECVVLAGASGTGKSSVIKMIFGNYRCDSGRIMIRHGGRATNVAQAEPRDIIELRRHAVGYVSQFLRALPRVAAIDIASEPLRIAGVPPDEARARAGDLLRRLNIPERLWSLPPATFSGGEQQRVNIARGFLPDFPLLLLDEPTASLDPDNRKIVMDLIAKKKRSNTAVVAIVHDDEVRNMIADRVIDMSRFAAAS